MIKVSGTKRPAPLETLKRALKCFKEGKFSKNLFCGTKQTKKRTDNNLNKRKFSFCQKNRPQLESDSRDLSSQAKGLQQRGIKLNHRATKTKLKKKINRQTII